MKKISNLNVDVWKETEVCMYEDEKTLMFLAPCQAWVGNALKELEEAGIYPAGHTAVMKREDQIILGYINIAEGVIQFRKADPKYRTNEFEVMFDKDDAWLLGKLLIQII